MSSFFGDLTGGDIRMPEARFNDGGMLPPMSTAGYANGLDGTADGRFNAGDSLLSNMEPYAYGKGDRLSTQTAYLANPHNIHKIVPQLMLPDSIKASSAQTFMLAHGVSDGDIAFSIRFSTPAVRTQLMHHSVSDYFRQGAGRAVDYICNMAVINYIIRGFCTPAADTNGAWVHFASAIGFEDGFMKIQTLSRFRDVAVTGKLEELTDEEQKRMLVDFAKICVDYPDVVDVSKIEHADDVSVEERKARLVHWIDNLLAVIVQELVRDHFRPLGVVIGSDKQGGQHELNNSNVTFPVSYVVTISVDGKNENICNYWRHTNISSGSLLGFKVAMRYSDMYTLNNHKFLVKKTFGSHTSQLFPQVVPSMMNEVIKKKGGMENSKALFQRVGFWQFCMSQVMHQQLLDEAPCNSVVSFHKGAVLQVTISVVWMRTRPRSVQHSAAVSSSRPGSATSSASSVTVTPAPGHDYHPDASFVKQIKFSTQPLYAMSNKSTEPIEVKHKRERCDQKNPGKPARKLIRLSGDEGVPRVVATMMVRKLNVAVVDTNTAVVDTNTAVVDTNTAVVDTNTAVVDTNTAIGNGIEMAQAHIATRVLSTPVPTTPVITTPMPTAPVITTPVITTKATSKLRTKAQTDKKFTSVSEGSFTRL
jgi:hypothetical protein